jgi:hypothetical protein
MPRPLDRPASKDAQDHRLMGLEELDDAELNELQEEFNLLAKQTRAARSERLPGAARMREQRRDAKTSSSTPGTT